MLGYIFFGFTLVFYGGLFFINSSEPRMSGEGGMGYGLGIAALGLGFAISSLILTISVAYKGGFDWITNFRALIVGLGWLFMAVATFACVAFKWEWHEGEFPQFLRWLAKSEGQVWMPLLMLVPYFFLLNTELRASVSPNMYKIPLIIGFIVAFIVSIGLLLGWFRITAKQQTAELDSRNEREISIRNDHLQTIANHKTTDNIIYLMALTGRFHDEDIRAAAVAKVKEKPNWEDKLIELLNNKSHYAHAYTFLDGNKVEHPELFLKPLNNSILHMATEIQESITDSNNLQDWHFEHLGIERLFRAIDEQFLNKGMDFRPAVLKLQEALNTTPPERFKNVRFNVTPIVKDWLKKHK